MAYQAFSFYFRKIYFNNLVSSGKGVIVTGNDNIVGDGASNISITSFVFYGVGLRANDLGVNPYLSFAISAFVELFACIFTLIIIDKIGRKRAYSSFLLMAGISCLSIVLIDDIIISLILAMIGKFTISASYAILRLYSNEVFPTMIRNIVKRAEADA